MATRTASVTGNWATAATWGGTAPSPGDTIVVNTGIVVTIAANIDLSLFGTLTLNGTGSIQINSGVTVLTVPSGWTIATNNGTISNNKGTVTTNSGTGVVNNNSGTVGTNSSGGIVRCHTTTGSVTTNAGTVQLSTGVATHPLGTGTLQIAPGTIPPSLGHFGFGF